VSGSGEGFRFADGERPEPCIVVQGDPVDERHQTTRGHVVKGRIGYTTGVFDLFHIGHLNILRRAREDCDYLIVGVATDNLSLTQKGKIPVIPFLERVEVVDQIRYVDQVVPYDDIDKMSAWRQLGFDVFYKGDDWKGLPASVAQEKQLAEIGVETIYFPYTRGHSSTVLRQRIMTERGG
jgi:glycerol-3-phosphate cytidylyltransferase